MSLTQIIGTTSSGKSSLIKKYILKNNKDLIYISTDNIFDELKLKYKNKPYVELKKLIKPELIKQLKKNKNNNVIYDDTSLLDKNISDIFKINRTILLYNDFDSLYENNKTRSNRDHYNILNGYYNLFEGKINSENLKIEELDIINEDKIKKFISQDKLKSKRDEDKYISNMFKKILNKKDYVEIMKNKNQDILIYPKNKYDLIIKSFGKTNQEEIYKIILKYIF